MGYSDDTKLPLQVAGPPQKSLAMVNKTVTVATVAGIYSGDPNGGWKTVAKK